MGFTSAGGCAQISAADPRRRRLGRGPTRFVTIKPKKTLFGPAHDDAAFGQGVDHVFDAADFAGFERAGFAAHFE